MQVLLIVNPYSLSGARLDPASWRPRKNILSNTSFLTWLVAAACPRGLLFVVGYAPAEAQRAFPMRPPRSAEAVGAMPSSGCAGPRFPSCSTWGLAIIMVRWTCSQHSVPCHRRYFTLYVDLVSLPRVRGLRFVCGPSPCPTSSSTSSASSWTPPGDQARVPSER